MAEASPLRRRMIEDMTIRNLSPATQQSYTYAVAKFSRHCGRSPDRLGLEDVRSYQLYLIAQQRSWSHINRKRPASGPCFPHWDRCSVAGWLIEMKQPHSLPLWLLGCHGSR
jgi:hypothetical protein